MKIVVTGSEGFIGKNLCLKLAEHGHENVQTINRKTSEPIAKSILKEADFVFHLAGVNRPDNPDEFKAGNANLTEWICGNLLDSGCCPPIVFASSIQATSDNPYGKSKLQAEQIVDGYAKASGARHWIYRLPNIFGKWARPNYNSVVATFCYNVAHELPISIHDENHSLTLGYIDDLLSSFLLLLSDDAPDAGFVDMGPVYKTTVGELAATIKGIRRSRDTLITDRVGTGLRRALHATYLSYLPKEEFDYQLPVHGDARGDFVEFVKTQDSGQMSYFTALPGVTRGEHYHHSKTEKFLVIKGTARFGFHHIETDEKYGVDVEGGSGRVVETVPGWSHNVTNIGSEELIVMLWANEIFNPELPDTIAKKVQP